MVFATGISGLVLWERSCMTNRWWLKDRWNLGRASYSIFLTHGFLLMAVFRAIKPQMLGDGSIWINVFLLHVVAVLVLFGVAVHLWWERPLMRWCKSMGGLAREMPEAVS